VAKTSSNQTSLFEENYLLRTYGTVVRDPDTALTELVANAWDAGAAVVKLQIPSGKGEELSIDDDGTGMTHAEFIHRWMTLGYDRVRHQSEWVEFPADRRDWSRRRVYGRNGIGRHGMMCFDDEYVVETRVDGRGQRYFIAARSGSAPFAIVRQEEFSRAGHGTTLTCRVQRHLPSVTRIREVLGARFLFDPQFTLMINGRRLTLPTMDAVRRIAAFKIDGKRVQIDCVDSNDSNRTTQVHGVVFWVDKRRVGNPSWVVNGRVLLDGRRSIAKRVTFVVHLDGFEESVLPDWSGFSPSEEVDRMLTRVAESVASAVEGLHQEEGRETRQRVLADAAPRLRALSNNAQRDVRSFVDEVVANQPAIAPEALEVTVAALVHLEETKSGRELLMKLQKLSPEDVDGLNRVLEEWTVRDAQNVLDEIGRRASVVEALEKLVKEPTVDELATIHPLVSQARWLFGPEYEAASFTSNVTIKTVVERLFGASENAPSFINPKKRPDLVFRPTSTFSVVATQKFSLDEPNLPEIDRVLVIELKRGGFKVGRDEVDQAGRYVEDLISLKDLGGRPTVSAFVVGFERGEKTHPRKVGEDDRGRVVPTTYAQLISVANARLFQLRERIAERFDGQPVDQLVSAVQDRLL